MSSTCPSLLELFDLLLTDPRPEVLEQTSGAPGNYVPPECRRA